MGFVVSLIACICFLFGISPKLHPFSKLHQCHENSSLRHLVPFSRCQQGLFVTRNANQMHLEWTVGLVLRKNGHVLRQSLCSVGHVNDANPQKVTTRIAGFKDTCGTRLPAGRSLSAGPHSKVSGLSTPPNENQIVSMAQLHGFFEGLETAWNMYTRQALQYAALKHSINVILLADSNFKSAKCSTH